MIMFVAIFWWYHQVLTSLGLTWSAEKGRVLKDKFQVQHSPSILLQRLLYHLQLHVKRLHVKPSCQLCVQHWGSCWGRWTTSCACCDCGHLWLSGSRVYTSRWVWPTWWHAGCWFTPDPGSCVVHLCRVRYIDWFPVDDVSRIWQKVVQMHVYVCICNVHLDLYICMDVE